MGSPCRDGRLGAAPWARGGSDGCSGLPAELRGCREGNAALSVSLDLNPDILLHFR